MDNYYFSSVLYGCETWISTQREEYCCMAHEKRVVRKICGPERGDCRLHNEKLEISVLFTKCYMCNQIKKDKEIEHVMLMEEKTNKYGILCGNPRRKRSRSRAMCI
jgi:hypothetical protein